MQKVNHLTLQPANIKGFDLVVEPNERTYILLYVAFHWEGREVNPH